MRETGWTWDEYLDQPSWLIDMLMHYLQAEGKHAQKQIKP